MKRIEKVNTCFLPTPLHKLENFSKELDNIEVYMKRDDLTGIGMGGNKLRKLDYIVKKALDEGCTTLLTYGGVQTNHGRLTAAAAARFGMKSIIMCYGTPPEEMSGNLVLDRILDSEVIFMDTSEIRAKMEEMEYEEIVAAYKNLKKSSTDDVIAQRESIGEKVYLVPIGGHSPEGVMGYFDAVEEIRKQEQEMGVEFDHVVVGNGSGGTYAGLLLGKEYHKAPWNILASNISPKQEREMDELVDFCNEVSEQFEMEVKIQKEDVHYSNEYTGIAYNVPDEPTRQVISRLAKSEGIFVDPCYTGKSFSGLLGFIEEGLIKPGEKVLFIHTGGLPGIWTQEHEVGFNEDLWKDLKIY